MNCFKLRSNIEVPVIGFGPDVIGYSPRIRTYKKDIIHKGARFVKRKTIDEPQYIKSVRSAFEIGFRLLDWSASYGDGHLLRVAMDKSGIPRDNIMITTRVSNKAQYKATVREQFFSQLKGFNTDYIDILMFHWPVTGLYEKTWEEMIKLKEEGYCKVLGVANCNEKHLERLREVGELPEINQVEIHPLFTQETLRNYCDINNIQLEAYSPTARQDDRLYNPPMLRKMSSVYNKSITQIILKWHIQNGVIPVSRSLNRKHQEENIDIFDFVISDDDMKKIDSLNINSRIRYDPDNCDFTAL